MSAVKKIVAAAVAALFLVAGGSAQETRSVIFGRVTDPQDAAVAGATVAITNADTNTNMTLVTNETGYYEANLLLAGNYRVTVEIAGFKKSVRTGIVLPVSTRSEVSIKLVLGEVAESVSVTAEAPLLDTSSISSGRVMENRSVNDLPTFNNSPLMLIKLVPGVQASSNRRYNGVNALGGTAEAHNAGNIGGNDWSIDGVPNMGANYSAAYLPYSTTVQEFKVETANFDAAVGHTTGSTISVMTKAGTNELHGALTEQHWQQRWNGTRFFVKQQYYRNISLAETAGDKAKADQLRASPLQPSGHSNNFAGTVGGPIVLPKLYNGKNKLFFFFSFDGFEDRKTTESTFNHTVPTLLQRQGDFSELLRVNTARYQLYDPLTVRPDPARAGHFLRDPIAGNIIARSRMISPAYDTYMKFLPTPNNPPAAANLEPLNNYVGVAEPYNWSYRAIANRFDYQHSETHRFFGRWSWLKYREDRQDWTYETTRGLQTNGVNRNNGGITADWVYTRGSSTVLDANGAANNFREGNILTPVALKYKPSDVGLPAYMDAKAGDNHALPIMQFSGYDTLGQTVPTFTRYQLLSSKVNLLHIHGSHTMRAGIDVRNHRRLGGDPGITNGQFAFNNRYTSREDDGLTPAGSIGHSWAAFMMGLPSSATVESNANYALGNTYYGWYAQDAWRISPKLTLNLGLRIEYELGRRERYDRVIGSFDPNADLPITAAAQAAYAKSPIPELTAANFTVKGGTLYPGLNGVDRRLQAGALMWLPRFGAAYQIDSRTVIRAGYGAYFDTLNAQNQGPDQSGYSRATTNPITNDFGMTWLSGNPGKGISPLTDPFPERNGARFEVPVGNALGLLAKTGMGWTFLAYDVPRSRQQRWRVDLQRQLGPNMMVSLGYAGSYSDNVKITKKLDSLPGQYWATGATRNDALATNLNQNVTNPYYLNNFSALQSSAPVLYQALTSRGFFTSPTIRKNQLLRPFSQMNGLSRSWTPEGEVKTHSFEAAFQRRFAQGFTLNAGYTGLWERDRDFYYNEFDPLPSWRQTNNGVPHRISATGIYELPFGKSKPLARTGVWSALFGGWQVAAAYEWQPGPLMDWGNVFYSGNLGDINTGTRTLDRWFNTSGFERDARKVPAAFHARAFPQRVEGLRADGLDRMDTNLQREFKLRESLVLQLRMDALNVFNRSQFEAPNRDPVSTNFGRVTNNTSSTMRYLLFQVRLKF